MEELMNVPAAAEALGVTRRTITNWIRDGKLAAVRVGSGETSAWVISAKEVDRFKTRRPDGE